jgi:hypothetical protein
MEFITSNGILGVRGLPFDIPGKRGKKEISLQFPPKMKIVIT